MHIAILKHAKKPTLLEPEHHNSRVTQQLPLCCALQRSLPAPPGTVQPSWLLLGSRNTSPCAPAPSSAAAVLSCRTSLHTSLLTWSTPCCPTSCFQPLPRDLTACFQPLRPIPWPLPSSDWVFSSRSQTNLKSFLLSGCFCNGFKCIKNNWVFISRLKVWLYPKPSLQRCNCWCESWPE